MTWAIIATVLIIIVVVVLRYKYRSYKSEYNSIPSARTDQSPSHIPFWLTPSPPPPKHPSLGHPDHSLEMEEVKPVVKDTPAVMSIETEEDEPVAKRTRSRAKKKLFTQESSC